MERGGGGGLGGGLSVGVSVPGHGQSGCATHPMAHGCLPTQKQSEPRRLVFFIEVLLVGTASEISGRWWLIQASDPLSSLQGSEWGWQCQASNQLLALLLTRPHPQALCGLAQRHLLRGQKAPVTLIIQEIPRVLKALSQAWGIKTKYLCLISWYQIKFFECSHALGLLCVAK